MSKLILTLAIFAFNIQSAKAVDEKIPSHINAFLNVIRDGKLSDVKTFLKSQQLKPEDFKKEYYVDRPATLVGEAGKTIASLLTYSLYVKKDDIFSHLYELAGNPDINAKIHDSKNSPTLYTLALRYGSVSLIQSMQSKGAVLTENDINTKRTALMTAATSNSLDVIQYLIAKGENPLAVAANGSSVFMFAAINPNLDVIKFLLSQGAKLNEKTPTGSNALLTASFGNHNPEVLQFLVDSGIDVDVSDKYGNALFYLIDFSLFEKSEVTLKKLDILIQAGVNVNGMREESKETVLMAAARQAADSSPDHLAIRFTGCTEFVLPLVKAGAMLEPKNSKGLTAYDIAVNESGTCSKKAIEALRL